MKDPIFSSIEEFKKFIQEASLKYGEFRTAIFYDIEENEKKEKVRITKLEEAEQKADLLRHDTLKLVFINKQKQWNFVDVDGKTKEVKAEVIDSSVSLWKERSKNVQPVQTIGAAMRDEECIYYRFEHGAIGKYEPSTKLYYLLEPDNSWKVNMKVADWIIDAQYDYEVIPSEPKKGDGIKK